MELFANSKSEMKSRSLLSVRPVVGSWWSRVSCLRVAVGAGLIVGLSGCISSVPSGFPTPQGPPTPSQPAMPASQSSPGGSQGSPQGNPSGQQGGQQNPLPSPGSSSPLPRPPTVGLPNPIPNPTPGLPSLPTLPDGSLDPSLPGMPSDGQDGDGTSEGEEGTESGADSSADGNLETGGELPEGDPEDVASGQQGDGGDNASIPGSLLPGTEDSGGDSGWEISNQLPMPGGGVSSGSEEQGGIGDLPGEFEQGGDGSGVDGELQQALEALDGEIMDERMDGRSRANDQTAATSGVLEDPELAGGVFDATSEELESGDAGEDGDFMDQNTGDGSSNLPPTVRSAPDDPDARDHDIIARQLREAAMAATDPELKEALWEEHRKYVEGKK